MNKLFKNFPNHFSKNSHKLVVLLLIALISIFVISNIVTNPSFNAANFKSLDDKKIAVLELAAVAAGTSTTLSLIPGDVAMPIANKLADLSNYFLIVLCAVILEKMILSVIGSVVFTYLIPFCCLLWAISLYFKKNIFRNLAIKLAILGIVLFGAIPASIQISDLMYSLNQSQIEQTVNSAEQNNEFIDAKKNELSKEDSNWMDKVGNYLSGLTSSVEQGISEIIEKGENTLSNFLDTVAVLLITACVIPITVLLIFALTIKILFTYNDKDISFIKKEHYNQISNLSLDKITNTNSLEV